MSEQQQCIFKGYLSSCQRGAEVQSISEKKWCSIREANKLRKDSLCSNLLSLNQDNLVTQKSCLSTYNLKTHIDRHLKSELSSQSCSKDVLSSKQLRRSKVPKFKWLEHCLFCGEDCNINVDQKHPDWWRESNKCGIFDRGKGKITFNQVILQAGATTPSLYYPQSYTIVGLGVLDVVMMITTMMVMVIVMMLVMMIIMIMIMIMTIIIIMIMMVVLVLFLR